MKLCQTHEGIIEKNGFKKKKKDCQCSSTTTHVLEEVKSRTLRVRGAGEDVLQQKLSFVPAGGAQSCSHFGRQFGGFSQS